MYAQGRDEPRFFVRGNTVTDALRSINHLRRERLGSGALAVRGCAAAGRRRDAARSAVASQTGECRLVAISMTL